MPGLFGLLLLAVYHCLTPLGSMANVFEVRADVHAAPGAVYSALSSSRNFEALFSAVQGLSAQAAGVFGGRASALFMREDIHLKILESVVRSTAKALSRAQVCSAVQPWAACSSGAQPRRTMVRLLRIARSFFQAMQASGRLIRRLAHSRIGLLDSQA